MPTINEVTDICTLIDDTYDEESSSDEELYNNERGDTEESDMEDIIDTEMVTEPFDFTSYLDFFN